MFDTNNVNGAWNCPHNVKCMDYDVDEIIKIYGDLFTEVKKPTKETQTKND